MLSLLLYTQTENNYLIPVLWIIGGIVFLVLFVMIFVQKLTGKRIKRELAELDKVKQNTIEYEFILKAMHLATWHVDCKNRTIMVDADFRDDKGDLVSIPEVPLDQLYELVEKSDAERIRISMEDVCSGRSLSYHETYRVLAGKSGMTYWEESFGTVSSRDEEGNPLVITGTSLRIDARKEMEASLIAARNKAEESDRLKTAFLANMGHEIRTPLNAIVGFADLLPVIDNDEDRNQIIAEIQKNNHKLLGIIDGLVSMSKVEAEAKSLVKQQIDLVPVLQQVVDSFSGMIDTSQVILATQFPIAELMVTTDIAKVKEIITNLVHNAVKFTAQGSITLGFDLPSGDKLMLWVLDTGKGIADSDQQRIFERFVKVDEYIPGTGLGLSVAKSHAESLGGSIGVDSILGQGSRFWVEIPLR